MNRSHCARSIDRIRCASSLSLFSHSIFQWASNHALTHKTTSRVIKLEIRRAGLDLVWLGSESNITFHSQMIHSIFIDMIL